jgi:indolepyruvate ferredoxin oxidoreductase
MEVPVTAHIRSVSLDDKYVRDAGLVYLTGIQALVRVALDRVRLDRAAGKRTGGFVSGYRGSPLGGFDQELARARKLTAAHDIHFQPGVNEELGATAVWGTQKVGLHGQGTDFDGVFGLWYGKAPGVDRAGDVLKQANASGTSALGGVLALAGDDHLAKSSILPAQSEFFFVHAEMPVLNPADLQDVVDYGLHGLELSRYAGLWTAMICVADTMDASGLVDVSAGRLAFAHPVDADPRRRGDMNRALLLGNRLETERLLRDVRLPAVKAYVRGNRLDRVSFGSPRPRVGIVATGKAYRDLLQALAMLGIDDRRARAIGLAVYKVAMPWPLEPQGLSAFARGLERVLVVEHKRPLIEPQVKDLAYHWPADQRPPVWGKTTPEGIPFLTDLLELTASELVQALMSFLPEAAADPEMRAVADRMVQQSAWAAGHAERAGRSPYFCSGCPHNTSTKVPEGARALPGIGCHAMTEIPGRTTDGQVAMGGEGVPWVGQVPFAKDRHVFANMGDGTYFHSGILAIRQAVSAKAPITYKILFNDAVAMTGGQAHDGPLTVPILTRQLAAEGVEKIVVVSDEPEKYEGRHDLPAGTPVAHRDDLMPIQAELAAYPGVSVLVYDQTCAAEKRRRRKRGLYPDPDKRLYINPRVCEGCGDCSVQSNCISVEPLATAFGEKRVINQSSCNKDFSCVEGFCPSFVWVDGAKLRAAEGAALDVAGLAAALPQPSLPALDRTLNLLVAGIGGMGVTTVGATLAMAGHLDGINASTLDMTGLAQKGGPVTSHVRFAARGAAIEGPRIPPTMLDALVASDLVVANTTENLALLDRRRTLAFVNTHVAPTAEFAMRQTLSFDAGKMARTLREGTHDFIGVDAVAIAEAVFGDAIFTNMLLVGVAWQSGALPLTIEAIETAIRLNGAAVDRNIKAFHAGRVLAVDPQAILSALPKAPTVPVMDLDERIAFLTAELTAYQDAAYATGFRDLVMRVREADAAHGAGGGRLTGHVVESLYRVMAYKDEYEVARLYADPAFRAGLERQFSDRRRLRVMLAPPVLSRPDPATGRPKKRAFGPWIFTAFAWLARGKGLRGTALDPFGYTAERRAERALVDQVRADVARILELIGQADYGLLCELARLPQDVRGYGPVKEGRLSAMKARREALLLRLAPQAARPDETLPALDAAE